MLNERSYTTGRRALDTGEDVLAAAVRLFALRGFYGTTMRQIAAASGVSLANIYNFFPSKSEILLEILRRASAAQLAATQAAIAAADSRVESRLVAAVASFVKFELEHRDECFVANSELRYLDAGQRASIVQDRDREQAIFEQLVAEGIEAGKFHTPYPEESCLAILTMCSGVTLWYRPDGPLSADAIAERYARYALALLEREARP